MRCVVGIVLAVGAVALATPVFAQFAPPPELQNRIPAPLPPPEPPPIINGPLGQNPPPGVYQPRRLNTHSDRVLRCRRKFLRNFPQGFYDPKYIDWERGYKWQAHRYKYGRNYPTNAGRERY